MKSGLKILLIALIMSMVSGCANMLGHNYYQAWQEHAYTIRAMQDSQNGYYSSYSSYVVAPANTYAAQNPFMNHYSDSMQYAPNIYTNPNIQAPNSPQKSAPNNYNISDYGVAQPNTPNTQGQDRYEQYEYYAVDPTSIYRVNQPRVTAINTRYPAMNPPTMNPINPMVQPYTAVNLPQYGQYEMQTY